MKSSDRKIAKEYFFRDFGDLSGDSVVCDLYIKRIKAMQKRKAKMNRKKRGKRK